MEEVVVVKVVDTEVEKVVMAKAVWVAEGSVAGHAHVTAVERVMAVVTAIALMMAMALAMAPVMAPATPPGSRTARPRT